MMKNIQKSFLMACMLLAFATGCTVAPGENGLNAQLHPPLLYPQWQTRHYTMATGINVCSVSSGYNGLSITTGRMQNGLDMVAESTRLMQPGATFTVSVNGDNYETYDTFFPPSSVPALVESLTKGDKAYLEWSELNGPVGRERTHVQNIVRLDDFKLRLKECRDSLAHPMS